MCGIVGYVGEEQAAPILLGGLSKLEYRGYDSAGIAVRNDGTGKTEIVKAKGRLKILVEKTDGGMAVPGTCGIGHTRWATHGEPSEKNAHPHCSDDHSVILVHNGIIENYQELKEKLLKSGYSFYSQTDTEIAVKLVGSSLFNAAAYLVVVSGIDGDGWISTGVLVVYCIMETMPGFFLIGGFFYMRSRKEKLLQKNDRPLYIDDDVYWKNGWYSNPNDKRLMVQDWACSWNYTTNMAKPAGKIFMFLAIVFVAVFLVWGCVEMWKIDFVPIELNTSDTQVEITSGYSDYDIAYDDITGVELLDSLPDDDYRRINGGADQHKMMGRFKGEKTGKCRMYLYVGYTPVLEIMTEDGPVYVNSRDGQETEEWMREIMQQVQPAPFGKTH